MDSAGSRPTANPKLAIRKSDTPRDNNPTRIGRDGDDSFGGAMDDSSSSP